MFTAAQKTAVEESKQTLMSHLCRLDEHFFQRSVRVHTTLFHSKSASCTDNKNELNCQSDMQKMKEKQTILYQMTVNNFEQLPNHNNHKHADPSINKQDEVWRTRRIG